MDRKWSLDECYRQLNNPTFYEQQDTDLTDTIQKRVTEYVKRMLNDELNDKNFKQYLLHKDPKPGRFYTRPKIHKVNNPGRPIVSSNNHPTERISQFVDFHLKPLVCTIPSYVKDTTDFLNKLTAIDNLPDNALLVSLDVTSLYTNIPHNEGIDACRFFLQKRTNKHIPTETICDLSRIILTINTFTFIPNTSKTRHEYIWARVWLLPTLIGFLVKLNATLSLTAPINHTCGLDLSTIFYDLDCRSRETESIC